MMCGNHDGKSIAAFWKHLRGLKDYSQRHLLHSLTERELATAIPFAIHVDGAEFHRHSEYFVTSWTSAFQSGSGTDSLVSRFPISLVAERHISDDKELWFELVQLWPKVFPCSHTTVYSNGFVSSSLLHVPVKTITKKGI